MAARGGSVHVATTKRSYKGKTYSSVLLRRSYRDGNQVRHETLGNLSHLPAHTIELVRRSLKGEQFLTASDAFECTRSLPTGHVIAVLGTLRELGLDTIMGGRRRTRQRDLVTAMVVARVIDPASKLATARSLGDDTALSTLAQTLGIENATADELYSAMDWLLTQQPRIESALARRHLSDNTLVLYDVSSTYFEGRHCPLAKLGHSRDGKPGKRQIVFGLLCNREGCPVAIEVFSGNTADPTTLASQVKKVRERFALERVVFVGDRGMLTQARIRDELAPVDGLCWITSLRSSSIRKLIEDRSIHPSLFDERDLAEIRSAHYPGERLIVCRNPRLADERSRKRQELLAATDKLLDKIVAATQRAKRPLRGGKEIGLRVGRVLNRFKVGKHYHLEIRDDGFSYRRREEQIAAEAALDGIYVIRTNVAEQTFDPTEAVRAYKNLSVVERAFRSMKSVDLKIRPIHHRLSDRVRAHVLLCMLAYYVEWHMRQKLSPLLFDDEQPELGDALRASVVAPAQRSPGAAKKAHTQVTANGEPTISFQDLLKNLATIVKNRVRSKANPESDPFDMTTIPTPLQRRALDLLGIHISS